MRSGTKNLLVSIQRYTDVRDPTTNALVPVWSDWKPAVFCSAIARKGTELVVGGQILRQTYIRFDFDYLDVVGITDLDVIVYEGVRFDIKGLLPDLSMKDTYLIDATATATGTNRA